MRRPPADPRLAAYRILEEVEAGAFADRAAELHLEGLLPRDRRLAMELAYGCVRLRARLDAELGRLAERPLQRLDLPVLLSLRLGLYQLRELRVPAHAAVNESVEGTRRAAGARAAGFVNAVLRAALRGEAGEDVFPSLEQDPVGHLSLYGSHPEWLVRRWLDRWPVEAVARLVELDNRPPRLTVRLLGEEGCEEASLALEGCGVRLEPLAGWPRSCAVTGGEPTQLLARLPAVFQDPAASAVVDYAGRDLAGPLLDACSGPGAKAMVLAWQAGGARPYLAADISSERLGRVRAAAARLGLDLLFATMDGRRPAVARAATVLLDVPCTGTGVLRRRPDARWRVGPERMTAVARLQRELLEAGAELVPPGGRLIYATCSLEPEENERQVADFLQRRDDFVPDPPAPEDVGLPAGVLTEAGELLVLPWRRETDGAYAARLRRREAA